MNKAITAIVSFILASFFSASGSVAGESFYEGKTITIIAGT